MSDGKKVVQWLRLLEHRMWVVWNESEDSPFRPNIASPRIYTLHRRILQGLGL